MNNYYYYDIAADLKAFPDCWAYIIVGGRNTGKTYGALCNCLDTKSKFSYLKRTIEDVEIICSGNSIGSKKNIYGFDLSPFKSINRDRNTNYKAYTIKRGLGGFWHEGEEGAEGLPIGYILSLSAVQKIKGFDLSECDYLIFDD